MLNKEFKTKWLAALRSGTYKQGKRLLRNIDDEYCCLGVACDLYDPLLWNPKQNIFYYDGNRWCGMMPQNIQDSIGISPFEAVDLAIMNDDDDKSFNEIANYIETYL